MRYNVTQDFLDKLHHHTKDIPKLEYVRLNIPVRKNDNIDKLNKYFGGFAMPAHDSEHLIVKQYTYKNIQLALQFINTYDNVKDYSIIINAKFQGSPSYRLLDGQRRNNFDIGGHRLPFTPIGFASARALLNGIDYVNENIELYEQLLTDSHLSTLHGWFASVGETSKSIHDMVVSNARNNELAVIDIYEAIFNATKDVIDAVADLAKKHRAFNTVSYFDTQFATQYGKFYYARQLINTIYVKDFNTVQGNLFNISTYRLSTSNDESNFINEISGRLDWTHIESAVRKLPFYIDNMFLAFGNLVYTLPYALTYNPVDMIIKATDTVEYFSKAIPDINLYYISQGHYISLPSVVTASKRADFEAFIKKEHDQNLRMDNTMFNYDLITHHYFLNSSMGDTDHFNAVWNNYEYMFAKMLNHQKFFQASRVRVSKHTYETYLKNIYQKGSDCVMCSSERVSIDINTLPQGVAYNDLTELFNLPGNTTASDQSTFNDHHICTTCIHRYNSDMQLYNGFFDKNGAFIGPDSIADYKDNRANLTINDYNYRPGMNFVYKDADDLKLGVELEVDDPNYQENGYYDDDDEWINEDDGSAQMRTDHAASMFISTLAKGKDYAYAMSDGSLNYGFEIATMPATLDAHLDPTYFDYEKAFNKVVRAGFRSHDTRSCGIHVHVDRSFFGANTRSQLYRAALMAYIIERNWQDVSRFSRRNIHSLEQWANKKQLDGYVNNTDTDEVMARKFVNEYDGDKYVMFNLQHHSSFELRIFRGTLNLMTYKAILQFVDNLSRFVMALDITSAQQVSFKDIIHYNPHPELVAYTNQRFGENYLGE